MTFKTILVPIEQHDLMSATRYGHMMRRFAKVIETKEKALKYPSLGVK